MSDTSDRVPPYANTSPDVQLVTVRVDGREFQIRVTTRQVGGGKIQVHQPEGRIIFFPADEDDP